MVPGVAGALGFGGRRLDPDLPRRLAQLLSGTGPVGTWEGDTVLLARAGYNSTGREGPGLISDGQVTVGFEGRIQNRRSLIAPLGLLPNASDSDIILAGYRHWQEQLPRQLLGVFTVAIVDFEKRYLLLVTDALGLRPVYYHQGTYEFTFGTDVRHVLAGAGLSATLNGRKLMEFVSPLCVLDEGWYLPEETFFQGVGLLPFATAAVVSFDGTARSWKYWKPPTKLNRTRSSAADWACDFRDLFYAVVEDHLDTPYPIGAELSGGIDSSSLVCVAQDILQGQGRSERPFHTYTLSYDSRGDRSEIGRVRGLHKQYAQIRGRILPADHLIAPLECGEFRAYRPAAHPCRLNLPESFVFLAQTAAAAGCRVLLSGEGADWYLEGSDLIWDSLIRTRNWKLLRQGIRTLLGRGSLALVLRYLYRYACRPLAPRWLAARAFVREYYEATWSESLPGLFTPEFVRQMLPLLREQRRALARGRRFETWAQRLESDLMFPPNHGWQGIPIDVEMRLPYLDRRLVDFGLAVPPEFKFECAPGFTSHYGARKVLQRRGLVGVVPERILNCSVKALYGSPVVQRLKQHLLPVFASGHQVLLAELSVIRMDRLLPAAQELVANPHVAEDDPLIPWLDTLLGLEVWMRAAFPVVSSSQSAWHEHAVGQGWPRHSSRLRRPRSSTTASTRTCTPRS
jgi:asparagine synthase (glutamine-hydrolysing)